MAAIRLGWLPRRKGARNRLFNVGQTLPYAGQMWYNRLHENDIDLVRRNVCGGVRSGSFRALHL